MKLNGASLDFVLLGGGGEGGVGEEERLFLPKTAAIKLICCFVFGLVYHIQHSSLQQLILLFLKVIFQLT